MKNEPLSNGIKEGLEREDTGTDLEQLDHNKKFEEIFGISELSKETCAKIAQVETLVHVVFSQDGAFVRPHFQDNK